MLKLRKEERSKRSLKRLSKLQLKLHKQQHPHPLMVMQMPPKKRKLRPRRKQLQQVKLLRSKRNKSV